MNIKGHGILFTSELSQESFTLLENWITRDNAAHGASVVPQSALGPVPLTGILHRAVSFWPLHCGL